MLSKRQNNQQQESRALPLAVNMAEEPETSGQPHVTDANTTGRARKASWWRKPSPWWLLAAIPFTSMSSSAKVAPRIEIYTVLACATHRPDIGSQGLLSIFPASTGLHSFKEWPESAGLFNASTCASDPVVQAAVAKLIAVIATCTGILSLLTTGYWSAYSDRQGRARVMGISILGLLLDDLNFILVTKFSRFVPGGYWFLVVGATIDGCLGGFTTGVAALHAYLTDTTKEDDRSHILSLNVGLLFIGSAMGPILGSFLIRATGQAIFVFFASILCTLLYFFLVWFIIPESITEEQMIQARAKYNDDFLQGAGGREQGYISTLWHKIRWATKFLSPLTIFLPSSSKSRNNIANQQGGDWTLTLLALAYGCTILILGSYQNKLQYAAFQFGWSTEMVGYYLSIIGITKGFVMIVVFPVVIKFFRRESFNRISPTIGSPSEVTPLLQSDDPRSSSPLGGSRVRSKIDSASSDLSVAILSVVVDIISLFCSGFARTGWQFVIFGVLGAFGMPFTPAMQSVTLALYIRRGGTEAGRLFGALSVIQAFSTQILGPALYGFVYARTVATFPSAVFFVSVGNVTISFILLLLVRLPDKTDDHSVTYNSEDVAGEANSLGTQPSINE